MKTLFLLLATFTSLSALASDQQDSFEELKQVSQRASQLFSEGSCQLHWKQSGDQLRLVLNVDMEDMVILNVKPQDPITSSSDAQFDGSYQYNYNIEGVGKLTLTHVDDSYDRVDLSDGLYNANCEIQL